MAKDIEFKKSLKKFRRDLEQSINERALRRGEEISKKVAEEFQKLSRGFLKERSNASHLSQNLISNIADSIKIIKIDNKDRQRTLSRRTGIEGGKPINPIGYAISIPIDKEGLVMFLEYGTGLQGLRHPHPESSDAKIDGFKVGWKYAVNRNNFKEVSLKNDKNRRVQVTQPCYITRDGKRGFVFKYKDGVYIDRDDVIFHNKYTTNYSWVKGYIDKNGRVVKPYTRFHKNPKTYISKTEYVLSSGIKPVRFIYDAKQEIKYMINNKLI